VLGGLLLRQLALGQPSEVRPLKLPIPGSNNEVLTGAGGVGRLQLAAGIVGAGLVTAPYYIAGANAAVGLGGEALTAGGQHIALNVPRIAQGLGFIHQYAVAEAGGAGLLGGGGLVWQAASKNASGTASQVSRVWPKHHPFPMYLGGAAEQTLKKIPRSLQYTFPAALDKWQGGKYARNLTAEHFKGMDRGQVVKDLREFYKTGAGGAFKNYLPDFEQAVEESTGGP
jgi:hypothetical protein